MARGINKVILIGNLGRDPEVRYTADGTAIANLTIATSESWKDQEGNKQEKVEWHRIVVFKKLAEICGEYLSKGSKIYIQGKLRTRKWTDKNTGAEKYSTEIHADEMQMLDSRGGDEKQQEKKSDDVSKQKEAAQATDDFDDDIPF